MFQTERLSDGTRESGDVAGVPKADIIGHHLELGRGSLGNNSVCRLLPSTVHTRNRQLRKVSFPSISVMVTEQERARRIASGSKTAWATQ